MEINKKVKETLASNNISLTDGLAYLVALHHKLNPSYVPNDLRKAIHNCGVVTVQTTGLIWNIPLFAGVDINFEWVGTEYVPLFKAKNSERGGKVREATARMKRLFAENPAIRKDEILGATRMYLYNTNSKYIRFPHYFIEKGKGVTKTQDILDWVDKYNLANTPVEAKVIQDKMQ